MTQTKPKEATSSISKWKTYPAYKDSSVDWLGEIPEHWEVKRLKYVIQSGLVNGLFKKKDQFGSGTKLVNVADLYRDNFLIDFDGLERVEVKQDEYETFNVLSGDIFFVRSSLKLEGVGSSASIIKVPEPTVFECHVVRIRPSSKLVISKYLINYLNSSLVRQRLVALAETTTMTTISQPKLASLEVVVPSLSEQCAIATFLDRETAKINTLITKKERLIELLQERRAALISHAVTKGLDPTVKMKDSGVEWLREIPEHWEVRRLKYIASILRGKFSHRPRNDPRMYDGPYPFIQTGDITATAKYITAYQQTLNETGFAVSKQFPSGTLVMAIAANIGDLAILQFSACFPDSIVGFVPTFDVALDYLYYNLTSMKPEMMSTATLNTQLNLNVERIGGLITTCPPLREQIAIANYLEQETAKIDALISRIRDGIEKLKEYSTALISAAVTGKIDVRGETTTLEDKDL